MLNPFFQRGSESEQNLVQSLINEQIKMYGVEVHYLPRKYMTERTVMKEVVQSKFDDAYPIEAYVSTYDGYGGQGTLLSKFGIQEIDDLTLVISKDRFETYIAPLLEGLDNAKLASRPKEGDLIYFPLGDRIFEIKYVEHESPFYQLQQNYVYELRCELFRYGDEVIDTDVEEIDDNIIGQGYIKTFTVDGGGTGVFKFNEVVVGSSSSITGRVNTWNATTNKLELSNMTGDFINGELIVGQESQAQYQILTAEEFNIVDTYAQNNDIEYEADNIIDFTEKNPFGNP